MPTGASALAAGSPLLAPGQRVGGLSRERETGKKKIEERHLKINFEKITILPLISLSHNSHTITPI